MSTQYPNQYYAELAGMIIKSPSLSLKQGEVCFYEGKAKSYQNTTRIKETPKTKTSLFITPFFAGLKRKKEVYVTEKTDTEYFKGTFYITNMRIVFKCKVDAFDIMIPNVTSVNQYRDGVRVISGGKAFDVMTSEVTRILHIIEIMNKAFTMQKQAPTSVDTHTTRSASVTPNRSRNDDYAIAAFMHYCEHGGAIQKDASYYPSYFKYDYKVNDPTKYIHRLVSEGYLKAAPTEMALSKLKVDELKKILVANGQSDKGKKDALIERIVETVDLTSVKLAEIYVPTEKGMEHLEKYQFLFIIKNYDVSVDEYVAKQAQLKSNRVNDIIWQILGDRFNESNLQGHWGLARNAVLNKAKLLASEHREIDALFHYIVVLYYDLSGRKEDVTLAPGIIREIYERRDAFTADLVDRCYDRYPLPHQKVSKKSFRAILEKIFNDETIDVADI